MDVFLSTLGIGIVVFASTNIDDVVLLSAFCADQHVRMRHIVLGQFLEIGALTGASVIAALAALMIPAGWTALLHLIPLGLGVRGFLRDRAERDGASPLQAEAQQMEPRPPSQVLAVAGVTIANGGDNVGVYIPLFASDTSMIPLYVTIFAVLTALWCLLDSLLVHNSLFGQHVSRYGGTGLPFVPIALGLHIWYGCIEQRGDLCRYLKK
jgi:cadmium resistance protein CadD (predicted permease)